jgi:hypothetical protein
MKARTKGRDYTWSFTHVLLLVVEGDGREEGRGG